MFSLLNYLLGFFFCLLWQFAKYLPISGDNRLIDEKFFITLKSASSSELNNYYYYSK